MENQTNNNDGKSWAIQDLVKNLRNGTSFLQQPNREPAYIKNYVTGKAYRDINMLIIGQGMHDHGKVANLVVSAKQIDTNHFDKSFSKNAFVGTAILDKSNAYYTKEELAKTNDTVHKPGEHKKNPDGSYVEDTSYAATFACEDLGLKKQVAKRDENNEVVTYKENEYATDENGQIQTYKKDNEYTHPVTKEKITVKAGDPVVLHYAGSVVMEYQPTGEALVPKAPTHMPPLVESEQVPLYKRKDESGKEIFVEKMTEAFRGKMQGNYEGLKITASEIDAIEKDLLEHPRIVRSLCKSAWTRAEGDPVKVAKMDEAIAKRAETKTNSETNENVKQNVKGKGRN